MKKSHHRPYFQDRGFVVSTVAAFALLGASLVASHSAGLYAAHRASNPVTDLVLSNIPVFDVDGMFVYGAVAFAAFVLALFILRPRWIPFTVKSVALFVVIRSAFVTMTHISPFPERAVIPPSDFVAAFTSGDDLFFSGHTGLPFLMALIFWEFLPLRIVFLASSVVFGGVVLAGHLHYSIDVMAAFFITYGIHHIARELFEKDLRLFRHGLQKSNSARK